MHRTPILSINCPNCNLDTSRVLIPSLCCTNEGITVAQILKHQVFGARCSYPNRGGVRQERLDLADPCRWWSVLALVVREPRCSSVVASKAEQLGLQRVVQDPWTDRLHEPLRPLDSNFRSSQDPCRPSTAFRCRYHSIFPAAAHSSSRVESLVPPAMPVQWLGYTAASI